RPEATAAQCLEAAEVALRLGKEEAAVRWLESALRKDSKSPAAHALMAEIYERHGDRPRAEFHRQQAQRKELMGNASVERAAAAIRGAEALLVTAGAGMGVDSGLADFRGAQGFWRAYPPYQRLGLHFEDVANPRWFRDDPGLAWGFYGHRFQLCRATRPHAGFAILRRWADRMLHGGFVFTSN